MLYYETAADFAGIDPSAMWEDFKVGMEDFPRWERVALVTDVELMKRVIMRDSMRIFPSSEAARAREWIAGD